MSLCFKHFVFRSTVPLSLSNQAVSTIELSSTGYSYLNTSRSHYIQSITSCIFPYSYNDLKSQNECINKTQINKVRKEKSLTENKFDKGFWSGHSTIKSYVDII